jgi:hypothetical protein
MRLHGQNQEHGVKVKAVLFAVAYSGEVPLSAEQFSQMKYNILRVSADVGEIVSYSTLADRVRRAQSRYFPNGQAA